MTVITPPGMLSASAGIFWRNQLHLRRRPAMVVAILTDPIVFTVLIGFVFGGSLGGQAYREYMVAGLFTQAAIFTASYTAVGLSLDLEDGMVDRFRTLPIPRLAVLAGRTTSDLVNRSASLAMTALCGLAVGWRPHTGPLEIAGAFALCLLFAFAMSWIGAFVALVTPNVQVATSLGLFWLFPASFVSSGFVVTTTLPGPLQAVADWSPVSGLGNSMRALFGNPPPPGYQVPHGWAAQHPITYTVCACALLIILFAALSVWRYRRRTNR
ncbi:ABC transporter permease [Lentzea sp. NBC_00516]|uniref:ABC transporter permease n=1 Tax=Lentzea sp. NBC_00516 TaxID=2903582 RepID=UPI002E80DE65|nr:ABC transporter permease [Lentzea sp. NBC_00516]WUD28591.1 ABC transporter permease [Lentzea sp. NBC_00516]